MRRKFWLAGLASGTVFMGIGCCHTCKKSCGPRDPYPPKPSTAPGVYMEDPVPGSRGGIPSPNIPVTPGAPETRNYLPPSPDVPPFSSTRPGTEILYPDNTPTGTAPVIGTAADPLTDPRRTTRGFLEDPIRPPTGTEPPLRQASPAAPGGDLPPRTSFNQPAAPGLSEPTAPATKSDVSGLGAPVPRGPVGLPGYMPVSGRDGVATGRKPTLEGFDWLKANGFKTVIYLHAPATDVAPARDVAEKRGLRFVAIAVAPATLKPASDSFAAAIGDRAQRPAYVVDEDGTRAGGLWYLLFRTVDLLNDDAARVRATSLGLPIETATEEQKQLWLAIQDVLSKR
ncbi:fused DSP-PTPase phosphatase/NAD kinase-like protein [Fimbriiglobus ruber]|uniref:DSP-PTPase phosphatase fused to NAD+ Kinase domain-containing protein n=1 Tax=Fimbriiglobus ruber TaxID=1908690 RepID=A0A225DGJ3_9BACT|nr:hypothetical protein [Fimbriiglobus ruber]OWK35525.1 hypothetical protein FRUB_08088 [Fimbriiglobus ruber]